MVRTALRIAIAAAVMGGLGACVHIPQRAWANGQAMTQSRAYESVMSGNKSIQAHKELMWSLNPLRVNYQEKAYAPFGDWWY